MELLYAIPGLGTTKELFRNIAVPNYELRVLDWPRLKPGLSLKDYALSFLSQVDQGKPLNLIGVSFGGMLCAELAEHVPVNQVFLVSSCRNSSEFPPLLRSLKLLPVYRLFPDTIIRRLARTKRKFIGFEKSFEPVFFEMIDCMPENYFACCIGYIINWSRKENKTTLIKIHGSADSLLLPGKVKINYTITGGSHAMVLNKADEINHILNKELNGL